MFSAIKKTNLTISCLGLIAFAMNPLTSEKIYGGVSIGVNVPGPAVYVGPEYYAVPAPVVVAPAPVAVAPAPAAFYAVPSSTYVYYGAPSVHYGYYHHDYYHHDYYHGCHHGGCHRR